MAASTRKFDLRLPDEMLDELETIAAEKQQERGKTVATADVVRAAIADWLRRGKYDLPDEPLVSRGGDRVDRRKEPA